MLHIKAHGGYIMISEYGYEAVNGEKVQRSRVATMLSSLRYHQPVIHRMAQLFRSSFSFFSLNTPSPL